MIIGYLLLIGGAWQLIVGIGQPETALTAVGAAWVAAGLANVALSHRARRRARDDGAVTPGSFGSGSLGSGGLVTTDHLAYLAPGRRRSTDGALTRGLIALACAAIAVGVGIWRVASTGLVTAPEPSSIAQIVTGAVVGFLCLFGLLVYAVSGVERSAVHPATVVIREMKETALNSNGGGPYLRFVLDVAPQGLPRYEATIQAPVPVLAVSKLAVGAEYSARVAGPDKPSAVIVNWNSPLPRRAPAAAAPADDSPQIESDPATRLRELDTLSSQGLISADEYQAQRARILDSI